MPESRDGAFINDAGVVQFVSIIMCFSKFSNFLHVALVLPQNSLFHVCRLEN
jgi:hypothetical protein